ncbi:MAG: hypothetical protein WCG80_17950 [Spirochaetales bacterium]
MKDHYDFSKAVHGKFLGQVEELRLPVYLDPEVESELESLAHRSGRDVNDLANTVLKNGIALLKATEAR